MSKNHYDPLQVPPAAQKQGGAEILRAAIVNEGLALSVRRGFDDPTAWGLLLGGIAHEVAHIYAREIGVAESEALGKIAEAFKNEVASTAAVKPQPQSAS